MNPQQVHATLAGALRSVDFVVHDDDPVTPSPFPGDAIAYLHDDQVELYLVDGTLQEEGRGKMAADLAAEVITAAGLQAGPEAARALLNGRVIVTVV